MMRNTMIGAGLAAALLAVAGMQVPDEALAGTKSLARKTETKRTGKGNKGTFNKRTFNKGTFTPPNPVRPPSPVVPPSPVKR